MVIYDYVTSGGKNLILDYISNLSSEEQLEIYDVRNEIRTNGMDSLEKLNTRQLRGKLWEIKISQSRIMYVLADRENIYFLHICKKQKGKAEKKEIDTALYRARRAGLV